MAKSGFAAGQLKSLVERVERLEEEKAALAADIREIFAEAKGGGFDTKIMRQVIRIRRLDKVTFSRVAFSGAAFMMLSHPSRQSGSRRYSRARRSRRRSLAK